MIGSGINRCADTAFDIGASPVFTSLLNSVVLPFAQALDDDVSYMKISAYPDASC